MCRRGVAGLEGLPSCAKGRVAKYGRPFLVLKTGVAKLEGVPLVSKGHNKIRLLCQVGGCTEMAGDTPHVSTDGCCEIGGGPSVWQ